VFEFDSLTSIERNDTK